MHRRLRTSLAILAVAAGLMLSRAAAFADDQSGGYVVFIEAAGVGQTQHIMRRKIAVVR